MDRQERVGVGAGIEAEARGFDLLVDDRHAERALPVFRRGGGEQRREPVASPERGGAHSTPLHQAVINEDVEMMKLLLARGARADIRDTLWNGTPLGWAVHSQKPKAEAYLRALVGT